jgi:hypothetical protein
LQDDYEKHEASVRKLNEEGQPQKVAAATAGGPLGGVTAVVVIDTTQGAVCEICHKTKFADCIGNQCHYCGVRSCSRCGSKMALESDKVRTV